MEKKDKPVILGTDENAARYLTNIKGWVDINNHYWGEDERAARYASSTHAKCECGNLMEKQYSKCADCRHKLDWEAFNKLPSEVWLGDSFIYSKSADKYFRNEDELLDYIDDSEEDTKIESLMLVHCVPNYFTPIEFDMWQDIMPEDEEELPKELEDAVNLFNCTIKNLKPASYSPGKVRAIVQLAPKH